MILTPSWFPWQQAFIRERQMRTNHRRSVAAYSRDTGTSSTLFALQRWDVRLTNLMHDHTVEGHTKTEAEIKKAEQYEASNRSSCVCWTIRKYSRSSSLW